MPTLKEQFLDIIFPRHCLGCNALLTTTPEQKRISYICQPCLKSIAFKNDFACAFCGSPVKNGKTCPYCTREYFLDRLIVTASYENPLVEKMLKTVKYRFVRSLADDIASSMSQYLKIKIAAGIIPDNGSMTVVPVPLSPRRLNWRGFNQSEIIAKHIAGSFDWLLSTKLLTRTRSAKPQADMPNRQARIENMVNIFKTNLNQANPAYLAGKNILLIDDISTSGSTLNDCARALKGAGAKEVIGFVFARNKN